GHRVHLVLDAENNFCEENFDIAMRTFQKESDDSSSQEEEEDRAMNRRNRKKRRKRKGYDVKSCKSIVRSVMEREWAPVIIFSFGRMEVEAYATAFENEDYNSGQPCLMVVESVTYFISFLQTLKKPSSKRSSPMRLTCSANKINNCRKFRQFYRYSREASECITVVCCL